MAKTRRDLQTVLQTAIGQGKKVYFDPPASIKITYPCILYSYAKDQVNYASDIKYKNKMLYTVTVIDTDPDSLIPDAIRALPYSSFDRHFTADNLHHFVFNLYF